MQTNLNKGIQEYVPKNYLNIIEATDSVRNFDLNIGQIAKMSIK